MLLKGLKNNLVNLKCFESIEVFEPILNKTKINTQISLLNVEGVRSNFNLKINYDETITQENRFLLRLASIMPLLNYGLFTNNIKLNFNLSKADFSLITDLIEIFSKDILINKFLRKKNPYLIKEFALSEKEILRWHSSFRARLLPNLIIDDEIKTSHFNKNCCGVLSSGGKESLVTYGILTEIGAEVYPLYVNESGGHWRTALPAYRKFKELDPKTVKVWTNIDRFYTFMLDNMRIIRKDHRKIWSDTYPIRLSIFPFYIFLLLPIFCNKKIGNILLGSEFDDPRTSSNFNGIEHYFGVYDQSQNFDIRMEEWYSKRMKGLRQWSAVRSISGLIVERILTKRYPNLARLQRSCHSCHFHKKDLIPCGKCSKCQGVLLFLLANNVNPAIMGYSSNNVTELPIQLEKGNLRLDEDEKNQALFLSNMLQKIENKNTLHIETIHNHKIASDLQLLPDNFRCSILKILMKYTIGVSYLKKKSWIIKHPSLDLFK